MRRIVIVVPGWLGETEEDSVLLRPGEGLAKLAGSGEVFRLESPYSESPAPDAALLGLDPTVDWMAPGPLAASCFGAAMPPNSTAYHLSILSLQNNATVAPVGLPDDDAANLVEATRVLENSNMRLVAGEGCDHALLSRYPTQEVEPFWPSAVAKNGFRASMDVLDSALRRFVDDSINVLSENEINRRRADEGLSPANLLWPWGPGKRRAISAWDRETHGVPVLASGSIRLHGFAGFAKVARLPRKLFRTADGLPFQTLSEAAYDCDAMIVHIPNIARARRSGDQEKASWISERLQMDLLEPIMEQAQKTPTLLGLFAPGAALGLGVISSSTKPLDNDRPFDERSLEGSGVRTALLHTAIRSFFSNEG